MKQIVITGSTRGIGYGLADAFLRLGCSVTVSGRTQAAADAAVAKLAAAHPGAQIFGQACDVRRYEEVKALWDAARARFGQVDIWINNAGFSGTQMQTWRVPPAQAEAIITTNLLGLIYGSRVAVEGMLAQGSGAVYNMEGAGSNGHVHDGLTLYGTTKYAIRYFTDALAHETRATPLIVGALRPGMVITDMIMSQYEGRPAEWKRAKRIFNIIADRVEDVAPWMAEQLLSNQKSGARISWMSRWRVLGRFAASPFRKRTVVE